MSFSLFMFFGTLEQLAFFYLCGSLFRFNANSYMLRLIILGSPIILVNYLIRLEDPISGLAPLFTLIMIILYVQVFLKEVSLLWGTIMVMVSYFFMGLIQSIIVIVLTTTRITTLKEIQNHSIESYGLQLLTALIVYFIAQFLYKRGIGFTFALDRFKVAGENVIILIILFVSLVAMGIIFFVNDVMVIAVVLALPFLYLTYYAIRKQAEDSKNTSFLE